MFDYGLLSDAKDTQQLGRLLAQCFVSTLTAESSMYIDRIGPEQFRVLRHKGQLVGGLGTLPMGQWFGGQRVAMTGIAAVGIAPQYRGTGGAIALMQSVIRELHTQGVALSALYPATQQLYRRAGYEQGGTHCSWDIPAAQIQMRESPLPVQASPLDANILRPLHEQQAQQNNGNLDRHRFLWERILYSGEEEDFAYAYLIGTAEVPQGYIVFSQERKNDRTILSIKDWVALTAEAGRSLWTFLAGHRSQIDRVQWRGSAVDLFTLLLPEQRTEPRFVDRWMLRIIQVPQALEARGYPHGIETELHLEIEDDLLSDNSGRFILSVSDGRGTVSRGGTGDLKIGIRGLAPLYTGLFSAHQLRQTGYLEGSDQGIAIATQLFAASPPWTPDFF